VSSHNPPGFERALIGIWVLQSGLDELCNAKIPMKCTCHTTAVRSHERDCQACTMDHLINSAFSMHWVVSMLESVFDGEAKGMPAILDRLRTALEENVFEASSPLLAATILRLNGEETGPLVDEDEADEPAIIQSAGCEPCTAA
jgi:hypothetical protein